MIERKKSNKNPIVTLHAALSLLHVHFQRIQIARQDRPYHWRQFRYRRGTTRFTSLHQK